MTIEGMLAEIAHSYAGTVCTSFMEQVCAAGGDRDQEVFRVRKWRMEVEWSSGRMGRQHPAAHVRGGTLRVLALFHTCIP